MLYLNETIRIQPIRTIRGALSPAHRGARRCRR
jgi:hypothetical protein